jgi:hypothetical protein
MYIYIYIYIYYTHSLRVGISAGILCVDNVILPVTTTLLYNMIYISLWRI